MQQQQWQAKATDLTWHDYPAGTVARQSWAPGQWEKGLLGWKHSSGAISEYPGCADQILLPQVPRHSSTPAAEAHFADVD